MKAIILAAGRGTRMGRYTKDRPKGMLVFNGKPLIEWQLQVLRAAGISRIAVVTGYAAEHIAYDGVTYYHNEDYAQTNMVESLFRAEAEFDDDLLVCYADILYSRALVEAMAAADAPIAVAVDEAWRAYWSLRYGTTEHDLESLSVENGRITELGRSIDSSAELPYRYIGLIKLAREILPAACRLYAVKRAAHEPWDASGNAFPQGYMTDFLTELIQAGHRVAPVVTAGQWLEFDTDRDYEVTVEALEQGTLKRIFDEPLILGGP